MGEFELIRTYFAKASQSDDVVLGIGDDCAVVQPPEGRQLVMSIDTMVEGVHFPKGTDPEHIGTRVMCASLSDLAAMGARAHWFTLALTLPESNADWLARFAEGMFSVANQSACSLIGGDTTRGPLCISVQVHGSVEKGRFLRRSGARPDDIVYVTGDLGDGAAGLAIIQKKMTVSPSVYGYLLKRFYSPTPRFAEGEMLIGVASSAIDLSDGLYADLGRICEASAVGAVLDISRIPISPLWRDYTSESQRLQWALTGGDDYQLCFTVPRDQVARVEGWIREGRLSATAIGKITNRQGVVLVKNGKPFELERRGYDHFG